MKANVILSILLAFCGFAHADGEFSLNDLLKSKPTMDETIMASNQDGKAPVTVNGVTYSIGANGWLYADGKKVEDTPFVNKIFRVKEDFMEYEALAVWFGSSNESQWFGNSAGVYIFDPQSTNTWDHLMVDTGDVLDVTVYQGQLLMLDSSHKYGYLVGSRFNYLTGGWQKTDTNFTFTRFVNQGDAQPLHVIAQEWRGDVLSGTNLYRFNGIGAPFDFIQPFSSTALDVGVKK